MLHLTQKGYSLVELLVVMGIMTILLSIGGLTLSSVRSSTHVDLIASEIRSEIMRVQAETGNGNPSGVYFETGRYVYFEGTTYTEGAPTNEESTIPASLVISDISLPGSTILFDNVTGNPLSFSNPYHVIVSGGGEDRTISVNEWGVVEVN